ncbi:hypothetical protein SUGI_0150220 [Cryptomeria japonica]|uniref:GDP-L-galactose phosphorylase 1 n=1 Tax=Cryptomeria japonica TaxID=3369 RepID=UPI002408DAA9|nr:GDP-L-galactose phosphorylase 1 [Cryptomeria japonica]GLJ11278.1 hypothetical protein SUGI_0150220 [Cryptomeria japonica]
MLTIKRCPTVVSLHQEGSEGLGCGRNCLGQCCVPGSKLPLYTFKRRETLLTGEKNAEDNVPGDDVSFLDSLLLGQWEDRMGKGLFRYDVTTCETKVIPGKSGFIAQLNEGRHLKKRPTEFRVDKVLQPFDPKKFNFTKVGQEEVLFRFEESEEDKVQYFGKAPVLDSPNVIAINVSPIEYGHVLLVPRVLDCLPQRIDPDSFLLAMHMAAEAGSPSFRLGYNSLGAFATINHLHFQAYYMALPFPVEKAPTKRVPWKSEKSGVKIFELCNYPVRGLVFEGGNKLEDLSDAVANSCICLQENNIPYNILIADCGKRVFMFPQCYAERQALGEVEQEILDTQVNPAVWEISGHMVLKRKEDFERASDDYAWRLLAEVSLSEERFEEVKAYILEAAGSEKVPQEEEEENAVHEAAHMVEDEVTVFQSVEKNRNDPMRVTEGCLVLQ